MKTNGRISAALEGRCQDLRIKDVRIGLGYTAVQLEDDRTGVAFTMGQDAEGCCSAFPGSEPLAGKPAVELLRLLESPVVLEVVVGLATANALANVRPDAALSGDVLDILAVRPQDKVAMIGYFHPLVSSLRQRAGRLEIFEERAEGIKDARPPADAPEVLPTCDVALITSTSLINGTVDGLLELSSNCREVVLLGSSTPLLPEAFSGTPVTMLSGISVVDPAGILRTVSEGRGTRFFKPFASKWNLPVRSPVA